MKDKINVLQVNNCDLPGRAFNGYDLAVALNKKGISAKQIVMEKYGDSSFVEKLEFDELEREKIIYEEEKYCVKNVLFPYAEELRNTEIYKEADIVHFHFTYHNMFSILDYENIFDDRTVWTIHDMWPVTGNCTNPLQCNKWMSGCGSCRKYDDFYFPMNIDNTEFMWKVKKEAYKNINPHIVVSSKYMEKYIINSPLTAHFTNVTVIPFGVEIEECVKITNEKIIIGFRADEAEIKGCKYIYDALKKLKGYEDKIEIQSVGSGKIPNEICSQYKTVEYGWVNDKEKLNEIMNRWDIFAMPSIGESFGLMAIEAMGHKCAVLCFDNTPMAELTGAPKFAHIAKYMDPNDFYLQIKNLIDNNALRKQLQEEGFKYVKKTFSIDKYVNSHIALYEKIAEGNNRC